MLARQVARLSRVARHLKADNSPIAFSKTRASKTTLYDTLGLPKEKENVRSPYIVLAFGVVLCGSMIYKFATTDADTKKKYFEQELTAPLDMLKSAVAPNAEEQAAEPTAEQAAVTNTTNSNSNKSVQAAANSSSSSS
ncbi:hypothetical protein PTSG_11598 [Salpingoeca rosetta]|uniref:Uncharacterized protein n=1 Tax=Salpingoeca rosetta (strain ATCC 50818 / BSB-021) TaxID=946362 RepID=F2TWQ6_SALR5|nr:uncharacterized protein PTSG_11598 [Salpingoeca rosetta]EGD72502.1 hypothetical protein PTSG_11598 [Salpingoeca rosetta]|eukprot:XP_004999071.1 hypothetical protein PTSG_11598 [Salpingoeca rosetta]